MERVNVVRIHLKTDSSSREKLLDFCLHNPQSQYLAVGWSCVYETPEAFGKDFEKYYHAVNAWNQKQRSETGGLWRMNPAINRFHDVKENDLFWTRDLEGNYWLCRAKGKAEAYFDATLDIGARVPVEAYQYGLEVPGQISSSFSRRIVAEQLADDLINAYSRMVFNHLSGRRVYAVENIRSESLLDNLPPFDLEELVIAYIQITGGYYVLSNSIANHSTTINIECEFRSRDPSAPRRAVVQVKGGRKTVLDAAQYKSYENDGYIVYLYAPKIKNFDQLTNGVQITREELLAFYWEYKAVLPDSITKWESLFDFRTNA